jgi:hypothetical protein
MYPHSLHFHRNARSSSSSLNPRMNDASLFDNLSDSQYNSSQIPSPRSLKNARTVFQTRTEKIGSEEQRNISVRRGRVMKLKQRLFAFQRSGCITLSPRIFPSAFLTKDFPDEKRSHELPPAFIATGAPVSPCCSQECIENGAGMIERKRVNGQIPARNGV